MIKIEINRKINIDNSEESIYNNINGTNIQVFTYEDYLRYEEYLAKKSNKTKKEKNTNIVNNEDDKIFRKMLDIKIEAAIFINRKLRTSFKPSQLEKYNSSFITNNLENKESDIIYKIKDRNIFILIEHQTKKDFKMAWRILEYVMEIIKSAIDYNKIGQKNYKLPAVIPIVLYTGKSKWNVKKYIQDMQEKIEGYQGLKFGEYTVADINDYTEKELLKENTYLSKLMLIEKYKKGNNFKECIEEIVQEISNNTNKYKGKGKEVLIITLEKILKDAIGKEKTEELIKKLKGDDKEMLQIIETLREEREDLKREVRKEEKQKIIKEMLKRDMPIELIAEITNFSKKKIKEIANT